MKGPAATLVASLLQLKSEGFTPSRDIILAPHVGRGERNSNGVEWLLANRRDLIDAAFVVNVDGGGGALRGGRRTAFHVQAAEKVYQSFAFTVRDRGGHSSLPTRGNPIYRLARALGRLDGYAFPATLNSVTRAYFTNSADLVDGPSGEAMRRFVANTGDAAAVATLSADLVYNALIRTTCVATMLVGGHAENALPQLARATVNCRMMPGSDPDSVRATLARVIADTGVAVEFMQRHAQRSHRARAKSRRRWIASSRDQARVPVLQMETGDRRLTCATGHSRVRAERSSTSTTGRTAATSASAWRRSTKSSSSCGASFANWLARSVRGARRDIRRQASTDCGRRSPEDRCPRDVMC